ncbi:hypothetical protein LSTR_LSTR001139 [Laodelphax striatellus]|uniref:Uncharacterized protein n=1 Tax=Laodelphax striatellus TaxID=195883 RepID=A0A482X268_LAOST|nr:hypothetical protein LSTR_LSTR001139 [Laodelphax striatellus]
MAPSLKVFLLMSTLLVLLIADASARGGSRRTTTQSSAENGMARAAPPPPPVPAIPRRYSRAAQKAGPMIPVPRDQRAAIPTTFNNQ